MTSSDKPPAPIALFSGDIHFIDQGFECVSPIILTWILTWIWGARRTVLSRIWSARGANWLPRRGGNNRAV